MADKWIKNLAQRVIEILGDKVSQATLGYASFTRALIQAAQEQGVDISDNARRTYAFDAVRESAKAILRYRNRQAATLGHPITAGITAPAQSWLEQALPPGDRD